MATCEHLLEWYARDLGSWGDIETHAVVRKIQTPPSAEFPSADGLKISIFTDSNQYHIMAVDQRYLACGASSRKPRAGEDWTRGNDLSDGPLTEETWHRILAAIVAYELVRVHRREELPAQPAFQISDDSVGNACGAVVEFPAAQPVQHASDCSINNGPALESGPCDCGARRANSPSATSHTKYDA